MMSKDSTLFNAGKILEVLENGLSDLSIWLENAVERKISKQHTKDIRQIRIDKEEKKRRKANIELAKSQDFALENVTMDKLDLSSKNHQQIADRIAELDDIGHEESHDGDLDRE